MAVAAALMMIPAVFRINPPTMCVVLTMIPADEYQRATYL
jgi:hypothetical protein